MDNDKRMQNERFIFVYVFCIPYTGASIYYSFVIYGTLKNGMICLEREYIR